MKKTTPRNCQLTLILIIALLLIPTVSSINESYNFKRSINCTGTTSGLPIIINGSTGIIINGTAQYIWTNCKADLDIYYNDSTTYAVYENETTLTPFEVEKGNGTSNNASGVWTDATFPYNYVFHFTPNITNSLTGLNGSVQGENNFTTGYLGYLATTNAKTRLIPYPADITVLHGGVFSMMAVTNPVDATDYMALFGYGDGTSAGSVWSQLAFNSAGAGKKLDWQFNYNQGTVKEGGNELYSAWNVITETKSTDASINVIAYRNKTQLGTENYGGSWTSRTLPLGNFTANGWAGSGYANFTGSLTEFRMADRVITFTEQNQTNDNIAGIAGYGNTLSEENLREGEPTIIFTNPTPNTNTAQYIITNNTIKTAITVTNGAGLNSTINLYKEGTGLINTTPNSTSINFTSLNFGTYYINASLINPDTSINASTETRRIDIYNLNINISSPNNNTQINRTLNLIFNSSSTSNLVNITKQNITIRPITDSTIINRTIGNMTGANTNLSWDTFSGSLTLGLWYIFLNSTDTQSNSESNSIIINLTKDATVNITAKYILDNTTITNFNINITDNTTGIKRTYTSIDNKTEIEITQGRNYNIIMDSPGYAYNTITLLSFNQTYNNYTIYAYTDNSVTINIYDETTGFIITQNITIEFTQNLTDFTNTTITGTYYQAGLSEGSWDIKISGGNYTLKTYTITVANRSTQTLNAYLSSISQTTIFTTMDYDTGLTLPGASIVQSRLINGSWTLIDNKISDISGRVQLTYVPTVKYQFLVTLSGYDTNLFYLDPVLFSTYNIRMTKTTTLTPETTPDYTAVDISFYNNLTGTNKWYFNRSNVLVWIISSPIGSLENYNLTLIYPSGNHTETGILATGEQFIIPFNITSANSSSRVYVNYCYKSTTSGQKCFINPYSIIGAYDNTSIIANIGNTYGLGIMERAIISTIIILMVGGLFFMVAGFLPGLLISVILMGFLSITGFMTPWMVLPSLFIGIIIIMKGGKE
jgi:hypothetical protein